MIGEVFHPIGIPRLLCILEEMRETMAKVYISYNHRDREIACDIASGLKKSGHELTIDVESLAPGQEWRSALTDALQLSDVFISLLTKNSIASQFVLTELGAARAF